MDIHISHLESKHRWTGTGNNYDAGPVSDLYVPVFDDFSRNKTIVAVMLVNVYWQIYFSGVLAENVEPIVAVLDNLCHGSIAQSFTYMIQGDQASYLGPGDLHDDKYDYLEKSTGFGAFLPGEGRDGIEYNCVYSVRVYPTDEMQGEYYTNYPYVFAGSLLAVFVFTSIVFVAYDRCVERRQAKLQRTAEQSTSVVASLFPEKVRARLFDNATGPMVDNSAVTRRTSRTSRTSILGSGRGIVSSSALALSQQQQSKRTSMGRRMSSSSGIGSNCDLDELIVDESLPIADLYKGKWSSVLTMKR